MHIPDGFLDAQVWIPTTAAAAGAVAYTLRRTKLDLKHRQVPMIALTGAFIFAAQMLNFPIAGATSGHFLGGALAAMLFGPWIGAVIMTAVLIIQAFIFQDGGITVLGANVLCTAYIGSFVGYGAYRAAMRLSRGRGLAVSAFVSAWLSIVAASAGVALLLAWSGTLSLSVSLQAMTGWHMLIGLGEGLITALVAGYLMERGIMTEKKGAAD